jgi:hypothetical protein
MIAVLAKKVVLIREASIQRKNLRIGSFYSSGPASPQHLQFIGAEP